MNKALRVLPLALCTIWAAIPLAHADSGLTGLLDMIDGREAKQNTDPPRHSFDSTTTQLLMPGDWMISPQAALKGPAPASLITVSFRGDNNVLRVPAGSPAVKLDNTSAAALLDAGLTKAKFVSFIPISANGEVVLMSLQRQVGTELDRQQNIVPIMREFYAMAGYMGDKWKVLALAGKDQFKAFPRVFAFDPNTGSAIMTGSYIDRATAKGFFASGGPGASAIELDYIMRLVQLGPTLSEKYKSMGGNDIAITKGFDWQKLRSGYAATLPFFICASAGCNQDFLGKGSISVSLSSPATDFAVLSVKTVTIE